MTDPRARLVQALRRTPLRAGICTDFDGTLSPIVTDPSRAAPMPGVADRLGALAATYGRVAVVSGRPVAFLLDRLRDVQGVHLVGLYGLERADGDIVVEHADAAAWRGIVDTVADEAETAAPDGVHVERKGLSVTLHVRTAPGQASWVGTWAAAVSARTGLDVHPARMSIELRPPIAVDKGVVVEELLTGFDAGCFIGDDLGDLLAFDALDRLASAGVSTWRVAVDSPEAPAPLLARADVVLDGPAQVVELLDDLL